MKNRFSPDASYPFARYDQSVLSEAPGIQARKWSLYDQELRHEIIKKNPVVFNKIHVFQKKEFLNSMSAEDQMSLADSVLCGADWQTKKMLVVLYPSIFDKLADHEQKQFIKFMNPKDQVDIIRKDLWFLNNIDHKSMPEIVVMAPDIFDLLIDHLQIQYFKYLSLEDQSLRIEKNNNLLWHLDENNLAQIFQYNPSLLSNASPGLLKWFFKKIPSFLDDKTTVDLFELARYNPEILEKYASPDSQERVRILSEVHKNLKFNPFIHKSYIKKKVFENLFEKEEFSKIFEESNLEESQKRDTAFSNDDVAN